MAIDTRNEEPGYNTSRTNRNLGLSYKGDPVLCTSTSNTTTAVPPGNKRLWYPTVEEGVEDTQATSLVLYVRLTLGEGSLKEYKLLCVTFYF